MSLPKLSSSPALSSHPSKQSLNRPSSRPQSIHQVAHTDAPDEHASQHIASNIEHPQTTEQDDQANQHPNHLLSQPFFTLIEDAHTGEYYHPTVHYIFSDDDTDIVTEAALRSLETDQDNVPNTATKGRSIRQQSDQALDEQYDDEEGQLRKESLLPDPIPGVRDNYIILDIDHTPSLNANIHGGDNTAAPIPSAEPQGQAQGQTQAQTQTTSPDPTTQQQEIQPQPPHAFSITSSHSLSPTWQVLNTQLLPAPTFENNPSTEKPANGGLMLQIQGTSGLPLGNVLGPRDRERERERGGQRLEDMMEQFARRMEELRGVIECGERGKGRGNGDGMENEDAAAEAGGMVHDHGANVPKGEDVQDTAGINTSTHDDVPREDAGRGQQ
ncbi:hypothetical protein BDV06DRAFT_184314 [Aspergillus oleicola]